MHAGRKIWAATKVEARRIAQDLADETGRAITVRPAPARSLKRNPVGAGPWPGLTAEQRATAAQVVRNLRKRGRRVNADARRHIMYLTHQGRLDYGDIIERVDQWLGWPVAKGSPIAKGSHAFARNPFNMGGVGGSPTQWAAEERARRARLDYLAATKARRLAKGLRGQNRGGQVKAAESAAMKTGRFVVKASNRSEAFTIYRASRQAAENVARDFKAAGYQVKVQEA